jgi:hypothetical protein
LLKFQRASRLKFECLLGPRKETQILNFFSPQKPSKRTRSTLPNRAPMGRTAPLQVICYISLKFLIKISLNKEAFSLLSKTLGMFLKSRTPMERDVHFQSLTWHTWHILRGPPVKEPSLPIPLTELHRREESVVKHSSQRTPQHSAYSNFGSTSTSTCLCTALACEPIHHLRQTGPQHTNPIFYKLRFK